MFPLLTSRNLYLSSASKVKCLVEGSWQQHTGANFKCTNFPLMLSELLPGPDPLTSIRHFTRCQNSLDLRPKALGFHRFRLPTRAQSDDSRHCVHNFFYRRGIYLGYELLNASSCCSKQVMGSRIMPSLRLLCGSLRL